MVGCSNGTAHHHCVTFFWFIWKMFPSPQIRRSLRHVTDMKEEICFTNLSTFDSWPVAQGFPPKSQNGATNEPFGAAFGAKSIAGICWICNHGSLLVHTQVPLFFFVWVIAIYIHRYEPLIHAHWLYHHCWWIKPRLYVAYIMHCNWSSVVLEPRSLFPACIDMRIPAPLAYNVVNPIKDVKSEMVLIPLMVRHSWPFMVYHVCIYIYYSYIISKYNIQYIVIYV